MSSTELSLDVAEKQVAIDYFDDAVFQWHALLLMINCGQAKWIWVTPDLEVQYGDLMQHRVVAIVRSSPYPARLQGILYALDPLGAEALLELRREAAALAEALGIDTSALKDRPPVPRWVIADPAHEHFGQELEPGATSSDERFIARCDVVGAHRGARRRRVDFRRERRGLRPPEMAR